MTEIKINGLKICQFQAKDSQLNSYLLCVGNISEDRLVGNMKKNRTAWVCVSFFG